MPDEPTPVDRAQLVQQVSTLIDESELLNVRLAKLHADVDEEIPDNVNVEFSVETVKVEGGDGDPGYLTVSIAHTAKFFTEDTTVATITFAHLVHYRFSGDTKPADDVIQHWVSDNVYFMLYPYVRETLHAACIRMDLPAVVLGYLQRGSVMPRNITIVTNTTRIDTSLERAGDPEAE